MNIFVLVSLSSVIIDIFKAFVPIIILLLIGTVITIICRYIKYGPSIFPRLKSHSIYNYRQQIIANNINKIEGIRKIIPLTDFNSDLLIIDKHGIYLIIYYDHAGTLKGSMVDEKLNLKKADKVYTLIDNPYIQLFQDEKRIKEIIGDEEIKKIIVFDNNCNVQVDDVSGVESVFFRNFYHIIRRELKKNYNKQIDVDNYYHKIIKYIEQSKEDIAKNE
ncbi:MAG: hypothetical protein PHI05_02600 [Bacilli bacterium]|nr:hypothetical protein [Bacilli bacterium]MDD4547613.1 hypothetical protein [Bacilli bacterium]